MMTLFKDVHRWRELLGILVGRNLTIRYKNSALGFFWSLLGPLMLIAIYAIFAKILKFNTGEPDYMPFLIIGIVVWQFLSMCLNDALGAIIGNANLIKKTSFPRIILPLSMVSANVINFLLTVVVLIAYLLLDDISITALYLLPIVLATQFALCFGLALILCTVNVFFRDIEHVLGVATLGWFFLTPVFYPVQRQLEILPANLQWLAFLNPMTGIVTSYRSIFMSGPVMNLDMLGTSFIVSWVVFITGAVVFEMNQSKFADQM